MVSWDRANVAAPLASVCSGLSVEGYEATRRDLATNAGVGVCARFATQQIHTSGHIHLACDATLLNEAALRSSLRGAPGIGPEATTAQCLSALYERFGTDFVNRLEGDFSVVLWDDRERQLLAAVDGFGVKRLVYYQDQSRLVVATRIDAVLRAGAIDATLDPRTIPNILNFSVNLAPATAYRHIQRLTAGTILLARDGRSQTRSYWNMRFEPGAIRDEKQLAQKLEAIVDESVAAQLGAAGAGATGAFLSGGTDSSTVVGMMRRVTPSVNAFTIGFAEQAFNELEYAELAAKHFSATHFTYSVTAADCFEALPRMIRAFDEPFGNSSAIATYFCARLAAGHGMTSLLAGDGGDELFGGNEHYRIDKIFHLYRSVPTILRKGVIEPLLSLPVDLSVLNRARRYVNRANLPGAERILSFQFLATGLAAGIFSSDFLASLNGYSVRETPNRHYQSAQAQDHLSRLLNIDMKITLADSDLPKVTGMTEMAGIQARFPYLNRTLADFAGAIPAQLKLKGLEKRYLFKKAFGQLLPREIVHKAKHGFGIPVASWLKTDPRLREMARDTLVSQKARERGYFRTDFVEKLFGEHQADDSSYFGDVLWTLLTLELWHRQYVDASATVKAGQ